MVCCVELLGAEARSTWITTAFNRLLTRLIFYWFGWLLLWYFSIKYSYGDNSNHGLFFLQG